MISVAVRLPPTIRRPLIGLAYVAGYALLDWMVHAHPAAATGIAPWDPPAGLTFALLLRFGPGYVPAVLVATLIGEFVTRGGTQSPSHVVVASLAIAAIYGAAALWLREGRPARGLTTQEDLVWFCGTAVAAALLVALAIVGIYYSGDSPAGAELAGRVLGAWIGEATGLLVTAPFLLVFARRSDRSAPGWKPDREMVAQALGLGFALWLVFGVEAVDEIRGFYLLFLPLIWIAMRQGISGATAAVLGVQLTLVVAAWEGGQLAGGVHALQLLLLTLALTGMFLGMAVTEEEKARSALIEREALLNRLTRLAGAGEMSSALAHELNQPLSAISSYLQACSHLVGEPGDRSRELAEVLGKAEKEAGRAAEVIRRLREFFRGGALHVKECSVEDLVQGAVATFSNRIGRKGITITASVAPNLPAFRADPLQIEMVLQNLLLNAIDALGAVQGSKREIVITAVRAGAGHVTIEVQDTGPGVDPNIADRLFQPFLTSKSDGMGLGLVISRSIVEAHGGKIWHEPSPGGGACFIFTLPIHD